MKRALAFLLLWFSVAAVIPGLFFVLFVATRVLELYHDHRHSTKKLPFRTREDLLPCYPASRIPTEKERR